VLFFQSVYHHSGCLAEKVSIYSLRRKAVPHGFVHLLEGVERTHDNYRCLHLDRRRVSLRELRVLWQKIVRAPNYMSMCFLGSPRGWFEAERMVRLGVIYCGQATIFGAT